MQGGQRIAATARTLGVVDQTPFNGVKAQRQGKLLGADHKVKVSAEQIEINRLRAELACVKIERDILEKAKAYVAKASVGSTPPLSDDALLVHIKAIHAETRGGNGWPRTGQKLRTRGIRVGKQRVQKPI